ncbi:hypothetical protein C5167_021026 [Papaver somniferum]|uniref:Uncharacterized protein n=1 Tax=Papaver somniferum TaxID=3469 RepID=A0A4Y7IYL9_PAPSO|nr:transcription factor MYB30-like [Papaver somniferum]RZC52598.1 hypothetical protein C5167_021026 [Papaver somniferum]
MRNRPRCCCDEVLEIKKGPWTPEEDHLLASYIKQHGPANWRSVPTNAGLLRCSKSCRLRWTNYLRPEIKRGNFTELEEKMIISLQSLWGNKWAAMASHLPQRTDNDIKNYWNTHLKKKLMKKFQSHHSGSSSPNFQFLNKDYSSNSFNRTRNLECDHHLNIHQTSALNKFINSITSSSTSTPSSTTYASSTGNISRLLEGWVKTSPNKLSSSKLELKTNQSEGKVVPSGSNNSDNNNHNTSDNNLDDDEIFIKKVEEQETRYDDDAHLSNEADYFESLLTFENTSNVACWEQKSSPQSTKIHGTTSASPEEAQTTTTTTTTTTIEDMVDSILASDHQRLIEDDQNEPPFSVLEKWLLDEATQQVLEEDHMEECSN